MAIFIAIVIFVGVVIYSFSSSSKDSKGEEKIETKELMEYEIFNKNDKFKK